MALNSLLVFEGPTPIGEYRFSTPDTREALQDAAEEILSKLKPELSGVILGGQGCSTGIVAISDNLPTDNPWYRPGALMIGHKTAEIHEIL